MKDIDNFRNKYIFFLWWPYFVVYYLLLRTLLGISYPLTYVFVIAMLLMRTSFEKIALVFFLLSVTTYLVGADVESNYYFSFVYGFIFLIFIRYFYFLIKARFSVKQDN